MLASIPHITQARPIFMHGTIIRTGITSFIKLYYIRNAFEEELKTETLFKLIAQYDFKSRRGHLLFKRGVLKIRRKAPTNSFFSTLAALQPTTLLKRSTSL